MALSYLYTLFDQKACEAKCGQVCKLPFQPKHVAEPFHCLATMCCRALDTRPAEQCWMQLTQQPHCIQQLSYPGRWYICYLLKTNEKKKSILLQLVWAPRKHSQAQGYVPVLQGSHKILHTGSLEHCTEKGLIFSVLWNRAWIFMTLQHLEFKVISSKT